MQTKWMLLGHPIPYLCSRPVIVNHNEFVIMPMFQTNKPLLTYDITKNKWDEINDLKACGVSPCIDNSNKIIYALNDSLIKN